MLNLTKLVFVRMLATSDIVYIYIYRTSRLGARAQLATKSQHSRQGLRHRLPQVHLSIPIRKLL